MSGVRFVCAVEAFSDSLLQMAQAPEDVLGYVTDRARRALRREAESRGLTYAEDDVLVRWECRLGVTAHPSPKPVTT